MAIDRPNEPERPVGVDNPEMGWGSDVVAEVIRQLDIPYRDGAGCQLSRLSGQPGELPRQSRPADARVPARGALRRHRPWLCEGDGQADGCRRALERRLDARDDGDFRCMVRPRAGDGVRGHRAGGCRHAPSMDRLDTHLARPGRLGARLCQMGRSAGVAAAAAIGSVLRANRIMRRQPQGPVYIVLDVGMQESKLASVPNIPDVTRFAVEADPAPTSNAVEAAVEMLKAAKSPLIMAGRVSRNQSDWDRRVAFAEALSARVITNQRTAAAFPTHHPLHPNHLNYRTTADDEALIRNADLILNLDWLDFGGTLQAAGGTDAKIISVSMDDLNSNGWSFDHHVLPAVDLPILSTPDSFVFAALEGLPSGEKQTYDVAPSGPFRHRRDRSGLSWHGGGCGDWLTPDHLCPLADWLAGPDDPYRRAAGLYWERWRPAAGSGPGMVVGSALALQGSGRLPVAIMGDGDFLMGASALWTAAHYGIPLLLIVNNNRSYGNDVGHQKTMAENRGRPVANKWIGQSLENPRVDIPAQARSYGVSAGETVRDIRDLMPALEAGIKAVEAGECYVLDVETADDKVL